jgi:hypothetical protein
MSTTALDPEIARAARPAGLTFGVCALGFVIGAAAVAGLLPIQFSIVSVFLCAGPHNWVEARYFLSRLPARWGRLQAYFLFGFAGVFALTAGFAALPHVLLALEAGAEIGMSSYALWNTLLVLWIATLVHLRSRQNPRRDWGWVWPVAFVVIALAWMQPMLWDLSLVYLHPFVALWILDREIRRTRPEYRRVYHLCLLAIPVCLGLIWWNLAAAPNLPGEDVLSMRITQHAGADYTDYLAGISSHCLVATHTFLEAVHYGVWLIAIPWLGRQSNLWCVARTPLGRRSLTWTRALQGFLVLSAGVVIVLWICFLRDYPITRDVYFTLAMVHVLAEVPFLLRVL